MENTADLFCLGTQIYDCRKWKNYRCVLVFVVRCLIHQASARSMQKFFCEDEFSRRCLKNHPKVFLQLTRQFFYKDSTAEERLRIIVDTFSFLKSRFRPEALEQMYMGERKSHTLTLWEQEYHSGRLSCELYFSEGELREGTMTLALKLNGVFVYHINFWILKDAARGSTLYIGCHQGRKNSLELNRELTKAFFGYRPKNFILYALRILADELGIGQIKAVSDSGFYANNHYLRDRKLKTSYNTFWKECEGTVSSDERFFDLPKEESRKSEEEIPARKRKIYHQRFAFMDEFEACFRGAVEENKKQP